MRLTETAAELLRGTLSEGDVAIDGTAGRGRDTFLLAELVGPTGRVHAFDLQAEAIASTGALLAEAGLLGRCTLHHRCHAEMSSAVPSPDHGRVGAAIFNLGYLPGGDRSVTTRTGTTLAALRTARDILRPGGRLICVCYTGHPGGEEEAEAVHAWMTAAAEDGLELSVTGREPGTGRPWLACLTRGRV